MMFAKLLALAGLVAATPIDIDVGNLGSCVAFNYLDDYTNSQSDHGFFVDNGSGSTRIFPDGCGIPAGPSAWRINPGTGALQFEPADYKYEPTQGLQPPTGATLYAVISLGEGSGPVFDLEFVASDWTGSPGVVTGPGTFGPKVAGAADPTVWDFFETGTLTLTGRAGTSVEGIVVKGIRKGPAIQYGPKRANDKSMVGIGFSTWIQLKGVGMGSVLQGVGAGAGCTIDGTKNGLKKTGRVTDININLFCASSPDIGGFGGDNPDSFDPRCTGHPSNEVIV